MKAVFGLGNPGKKYVHTRHNLGFNVLDYLAQIFNKSFVYNNPHYKLTKITYCEQELLLVKPWTFMNLSGTAVSTVCNKYNISGSDLLVVYDDLHLPFGTLRFRAKGSDGGHNGIKSIIDWLTTDQFCRLRIGIGDEENRDLVDFVLSNFTSSEKSQLDDLLKICAHAITDWVKEDMEKLMNKFNQNHLNNLEE